MMPTPAEVQKEAEVEYNALRDQPPQTEEQKKACIALIYLFLVTFQYHMYDETAKIIPEDYIQHNENLGTGRQSIIDFAKNNMVCDYLSMKWQRIIVDGEYVGGQLHVKKSPGEPGIRVFELLRYRDGVFVEHWDVVQPILPASEKVNPNGVF